jgi:hypothetical protein
MAGYPKDPKEIFPGIAEEYKGLFGRDLESIILYGSGAGPGYRPGRSDINFLIVLSEEGISSLEWAFKTVERWRKRKVAVPLFVTEEYVTRSLDVFPVEYLSMQRRHSLVYGKDLLADLTFDPGDVRLQCEREIKGKLLHLREGFLRTGGKESGVKELISASLPAFWAIFEALLFLRGEEIPEERSRLIQTACGSLELDAVLFQELLGVRGERVRPGKERLLRLFKGYMEEIRKLARMVDAWGG